MKGGQYLPALHFIYPNNIFNISPDMKRLIFLCSIIALTFPADAQSIRVKKIRQVRVEHDAYHPSFKDNSHLILLSGRDQQPVSLYNTRTRRDKPVSELQMEPGSNHAAGAIQAKVDGKKIEMTIPGKAPVKIAPVGEVFYIWVSVSPDQQRLLFTAAGKGTYVSDLDGNIMADLGILNAPSWLNNEWVLGMNDRDDGHQVISSDVHAVHVESGRRENLTAEIQGIALYPKASTDADRVAFHNLKGEVFTMKIKIKE